MIVRRPRPEALGHPGEVEAGLTGPGIADEARLDVAGVPERFWTWAADNHAQFPRGVDLFLSAGHVVAALPRTTRVGD